MWDLSLNDDERMIAESVREYLEREMPLERLRPQAGSRDLTSVRAGMVNLGWLGLGLPVSVGGSGFGLVEEMLVHRECGRYLVSPCVLASALAAHVAFHAGDAGFARALVSGVASAALGVLDEAQTHEDLSPALVFDWNGADPLLLWNDAGMGLFAPETFAQARRDECLDDSVTMHAGFVDLRRPQLWVPTTQTPLALRAGVLLAAALVGLAEHACDVTVSYVKVRQQFGKAIGSFQAVKHRCADMGLRWRLSSYQTSLACLKVEAAAHDAVLQVAAAKLLAARAAHENGGAAIQLHGAIGFQAECDVHWFMKRAHLYDQVGGSMHLQLRRVMAEPSPLW